jgi:luciferase family oxidoreductase group 1
MLGLPYAFASHFAPQQMMEAAAIYRERFKPVGTLAKPYLMLGCGVFAADTDAEARLLFSSQQQAFVNLRTGRPGKLPRPLEGYEESLDPYAQRVLSGSLSCSFVGSRETVRRELADFITRTGADELMVTAQIHDPEARKRSFTILSEVHAEMAAVPAGA